MSAYPPSTLDLGLSFRRTTSAPLEHDGVFANAAAMSIYLNSGLAYPGQVLVTLSPKQLCVVNDNTTSVTILGTSGAGVAAHALSHAVGGDDELTLEMLGIPTLLAAKAPLASPAFTGSPRTVTPANDSTPTMIANVQYVLSKIATVHGDVTSVAGKAGDVELVKGDVGLDQVDNTSDLNKPISLLVSQALMGKSNTGHAHDLASLTGAGYLPQLVGDVNKILRGDGSWGDLPEIPEGNGIYEVATLPAVEARDEGIYIVTGASAGLYLWKNSRLYAVMTTLVGGSAVPSIIEITDVNGLTAALGAKADLVGGIVPLGQLPGNIGLSLGDTAATAHRGDHGSVAYTHSQTTGNPHGLTLADLGGAEDDHTHIGMVVTDGNGKIPASVIPDGYDDIQDYTNLESFPVTGIGNVIYLAVDTGIFYRWTGTQYSSVGGALTLGTTSSTAHRGDHGNTAYAHSQTTGNPHGSAVADLTDGSELVQRVAALESTPAAVDDRIVFMAPHLF